MTYEIREAGPGDVDAIVAFGAEVIPTHYEPILGREAARAQLDWWTPDRMATGVAAGRVHVVTADETLVGVCETGEHDGRQVVWKLYLAADHRGRGIGPALLHQAIADLPTQEADVEVEHVAGNTAAARFYERHGFQVVRTDPPAAGLPPEHAIVWRRLRRP
ncbi:MAG: GNAT family N-acetyltransferase [Candidatus Nanopelagicales bacterium]